MKTIFKLLPVALLFFTISLSAQSKDNINRAEEITTYITEKMSLDKEHSNLVNEALLAKFEFQSEKMKGKNLTKEEKKPIYKEAHGILKSKLETKFSKDEIKTITGYIQEYNKIKKAEKSK